MADPRSCAVVEVATGLVTNIIMAYPDDPPPLNSSLIATEHGAAIGDTWNGRQFITADGRTRPLPVNPMPTTQQTGPAENPTPEML